MDTNIYERSQYPPGYSITIRNNNLEFHYKRTKFDQKLKSHKKYLSNFR